MKKIRNVKPRSHLGRSIIVYTLILTFVGLLAVADASAPLALRQFGDRFFFIKQQLIAFGVGLVLMTAFSFIDYRVWKKYATVIFLLSIILLVLVLIPSFGAKFLGARRWLVIGPFNFQPSEFAKLALCIYIASVSSSGKKISSYFAPIVLASILIMLQPDLGTTLVLVSIGMVQMFASGVNFLHYFVFAILGVLSSILLVLTSEYRRNRLMSFIKHTQNSELSYHIKQVLLAIGSGGLFGVGLGQSRQKFLFVPESASDSIFAIIAEEAGFVRTSLLILVFALLVVLILRMSYGVDDKFAKIFSVGVSSWIGMQTVLNIFSMLAVVPITGVPLPFISYGGTSLVMILVAVGILVSISRYAKF